MRIFLLLSFILLIAVLFLRGLKGTIFEISIKKGVYGGFPAGRELFLLVLLGCLLFEIFGFNEFKTTYVTERSMQEATHVIMICIALLIASISFFSKTIFRNKLIIGKRRITDNGNYNANSLSLLHATVALLLIFVLVGHATGITHAFLKSIISDEGLLQLRLANRFEASGPQHISAYTRYLVQLSGILLGLYGNKINRTFLFIYSALVIYAATIPGDKAPLIQVFILYYLSKLSNSKHSALSLASISLLFIMFISLATFTVTKVQFPEMNFEDFTFFIFERLGAGQIRGVYEQFYLRLSDFSYIYNEIPFSGLMFKGKSYSSDIMIAASGYTLDITEIGVMNSFFIGEALAIGGEFLAFLSPIIVAFNFCFICYLTVRMLNELFRISIDDSKVITALYISTIVPFTGDLSGLLFGKKAFFVLFLFIVIYIIYYILKKSKKILTY